MKKARVVLALAALTAATSAQGSQANGLPENAYLVPPPLVSSLFQQCSRSAPDFIPSDYQPGPGDITALEAELPGALERSFASSGDSREQIEFEPSLYVRHYAAYKNDGRNMIYGSFAPLLGSEFDRGPVPAMICDGGPIFFGVEYDVVSHQITRISFNGVT